jgi:hypothetical protein
VCVCVCVCACFALVRLVPVSAFVSITCAYGMCCTLQLLVPLPLSLVLVNILLFLRSQKYVMTEHERAHAQACIKTNLQSTLCGTLAGGNSDVRRCCHLYWRFLAHCLSCLL